MRDTNKSDPEPLTEFTLSMSNVFGYGAQPATSDKRLATSDYYSGFTLLEVLITIGIVALVLGLVFTSLYMTAFTSKDLIGKNKKYSDLMKAYFQIRKQIIALYESENSGYILKTEPGSKEKGDLLYIITSSPSNFRGIAEARYEIKKDRYGNTYLAYKELPYPGYKTEIIGKEPEKDWVVLSNKIIGFKIDCAKNNFWFTQWNDKQPPDKIRITFYYKEGDFDKKFSFIIIPGIVEFDEIINH